MTTITNVNNQIYSNSCTPLKHPQQSRIKIIGPQHPQSLLNTTTPHSDLAFKLSFPIQNKEAYFTFTEEQKDRFEMLKNNNFLNKRYISHLFGDAFMKNSIYEGWFESDALLHIIAVLEENEISPEVTKVLQDLKNCFVWDEKFNTYMIGEEFEDEDSEVQEEGVAVVEEWPSTSLGLQKIVQEIKGAILNLKVSENLLFVGGCASHSVLYEIKRVEENSFDFCIYNTGVGVNKHYRILEAECAEKVYGVYRVSQVKQDKITADKFIEDLVKLKSNTIQSFVDLLYDQILLQLEGIKEEPPTQPTDYMRAQRSGTCAWKVISAYCRYNLPLIQRKYIKLKARLDVFQKWYDMGYSLDCVKISQDLLSRLVINHQFELFRNGVAPVNFSREELLTLGIYKAKKTFNKYKFLLSSEQIKKAETWYRAFTGQSIHEA